MKNIIFELLTAEYGIIIKKKKKNNTLESRNQKRFLLYYLRTIMKIEAMASRTPVLEHKLVRFLLF